MSTKLQTYLGDSRTLSLPLTWQGAAFTPGVNWGLIWTAKRKASDDDAAAIIQKASGAGIEVTASTAYIALVPEDTLEQIPGTLVTDVQAQHVTTGEIRTVNFTYLSLLRDVTRETTTSIPVITTQPPVPWPAGGGTDLTHVGNGVLSYDDNGTTRYLVSYATNPFP